MLLSAFFVAALGATVKHLGQNLPVLQLGFLRCLIGLLLVLPFVWVQGSGLLRTGHPWRHLLRGLLGMAAIAANFYAVTHLTLAEATAITFAKPLFVIGLAVLFLAEDVRWRRWSATAVGFLGVLVMVRPDLGVEPAMLVALFGVACVSGVVIVLKGMPAGERPATIQFYFGLTATAALLVPGLLVWQPPSPREWLLIPFLGLFGFAAQYCVIRALKVGEATAVMPFDYARLLYATALGYLLFAELPTASTALGAGIIVAATLYIARREARVAREARRKSAAARREAAELHRETLP